ncbi:hypothetical protein [Salinimicrobium flavum]|uniref:WD40-like Beta Propeller Repeat n=1 Tax=Salinimicrobium flavum TaxID=1737065 RepID=A0ABW5IUF9_9FLAO
MKKYIVILIMVLMASCKDEKRPSNQTSERENIANESIPPGDIQEERDAVQTEKEDPKKVTAINGRYRKMIDDKPAEDCSCNCIDVDFDAATEWCIVKDKVYITARSVKTGENTADLFFVAASRDEDPDRQLPWEDFDTDTPVATLEFNPDGSADLDWIGFSTDGQVATDYAIYGKKTLEGTYKKD